MSVFDWSTTASSNGNSDASINFQEGQAPSTVNDSARALMSRVKHFVNMLSGNTTQGGASNAYTLTSGESLSAYADGMLFMWSPNGDSTGAVTLNLDAIGAKKVYMPDGVQANTGDLDADSSYLIHYDSALDTASGGFKISGFQDTTLTASGYLTVANNLSDVASAATARTNLGLNALAVLSTVNNGEWSGTDLSVANGGTGASVAATALSNLGGQPLEATLTGIAGLAPTANQGIYATGADTFSTFSLTTAGRALLDDASASAQRTTLGVAIGSDVQAYDANLGQIAALAATNSNFIVGNGSAWVAESGATARTSLGLTIGTDVQAYAADLTTYAGNPLSSVELDQLQNIGAVTISATQWGYLGSMSGQPLESETSHADVLVDSDASTTNVADKLMLRTSGGDSYLRYLYSTFVSMGHEITTRSSDTTFYSSDDGFVRKNDVTGMRNSVGITKAYIDTLNVDADTLDSVNSTSFARADATDTISGAWTFSATTTFNGTVNMRGALDLADNDVLRMGSSDDCEFFCNGSHQYLDLNSGIGNLYIRDTDITRFTFDDAGSFTATADITAYSDERLKSNILPRMNALGDVLALELVDFTRDDRNDKKEFGFIAQHVQMILPEMVTRASEPDENGWHILSVDHGKISTLYAGAIQQLHAMILDLQNEMSIASKGDNYWPYPAPGHSPFKTSKTSWEALARSL